MKLRLSILLLISLFLSGCGATAAPTTTLLESTPAVSTPQESTSTVPIVTPTMTIATILVTEPSATAESTITPGATATIGQVKMEVLPDGQETALPQPGVCQQPQNWVAYTVARNDTLASLGQRTGTSWQQIQSANCLTSTTIFAGQILLLPFIPAPPVATTAPISPTSPPPVPGAPKITITPQSGLPGDTFKFMLENFPPGEEIVIGIKLNDTILIVGLKIMADTGGKAIISHISLPGAKEGIYVVRAVNLSQQKPAIGKFTIISPPTATPSSTPYTSYP